MTAHAASLIHAFILIGMSAWGYLGSATPSMTALIPAAFGVVLLLCNPGVRVHNKVVAHIAAVLTLLLIFALVMPLRGALGRGDMMAVTRVGVMLAATVFAMVFFVKSFIDARKARKALESA